MYDGIKGTIKSDNIVIDLNTNNVEIFMNNEKKRIEIISK